MKGWLWKGNGRFLIKTRYSIPHQLNQEPQRTTEGD